MNMLINETEIALTQYSKGAGCGCKIAPKVLEEILAGNLSSSDNHKLIVGNDYKDDAAVYDLGNGEGLISTTDFFTPIVDDPYDFGRIAAANAISDVYAMGGHPLLALAILGWPVEKLPVSLAKRIIEGARNICAEAGITLAGGHSIDSQEPIFGLAVSGRIPLQHVKRNNTSKPGDLIYLTKPIGVGILTTAEKRKQLLPEHHGIAVGHMSKLNVIGAELGAMRDVSAMTDVTGFGIGGHLIEMAEGSNVSVELIWDKVPVITGAVEYLNKKIFPDATSRNWTSFGNKIGFRKGVPVSQAFMLLPDPQTNGGLLFTVSEVGRSEVEDFLRSNGYEQHAIPIGQIMERGEKILQVI
ncbi:MAG TPA: selenide, water dikinase SelD [Flavitalea sp.]|nr:selenide, water dikinase SelD [Flavitalea sp.]